MKNLEVTSTINEPLIILEGHSNGSFNAWYALNEQNFIDAVLSDNEGAEYLIANADEIADIYDDEAPPAVIKILEEHGSVICTTLNHSSPQVFHNPDAAPSEFEFAKEVLIEDLSSCNILTEADALEYISDCDENCAHEINKILFEHFHD
jgi:hypothetical protein